MDLNMDMGEILQSLFKKKDAAGATATSSSGGFKDNPYRQLIVAGAAVVAFIIASTALIYIPYYQAKNKSEEKLEKRQELKDELGSLNATSAELQDKLVESKEYYERILSYFGNSEDLRDLYLSVSQLASEYNMSVINIQEVEKKASREEEEKKTPSIVEEIRVNVELRGNYRHYMEFKQALSDSPLLLSVHKEHVQVDEKRNGTILIKLELSSYAIDKKPYLTALQNYEKNKAQKDVETLETETTSEEAIPTGEALDINEQSPVENAPMTDMLGAEGNPEAPLEEMLQGAEDTAQDVENAEPEAPVQEENEVEAPLDEPVDKSWQQETSPEIELPSTDATEEATEEMMEEVTPQAPEVETPVIPEAPTTEEDTPIQDTMGMAPPPTPASPVFLELQEKAMSFNLSEAIDKLLDKKPSISVDDKIKTPEEKHTRFETLIIDNDEDIIELSYSAMEHSPIKAPAVLAARHEDNDATIASLSSATMEQMAAAPTYTTDLEALVAAIALEIKPQDNDEATVNISSATMEAPASDNVVNKNIAKLLHAAVPVKKPDPQKIVELIASAPVMKSEKKAVRNHAFVYEQPLIISKPSVSILSDADLIDKAETTTQTTDDLSQNTPKEGMNDESSIIQ